ncbi:MAG: RHS repeat-associated core domain-containing protein [Nitrospira sp.]
MKDLTLILFYTHGPGIDEPIAVTKGSSTFFYHQDGLGSVTDLTDSAGASAKSYSYDAYGNILESPGTLEQPYTYTGRELDAESGLYYYRERYYDSNLGRFLQNDPGEAGIYNKGLPRNPFDRSSPYAYGADSPVSLIDPFEDTPQLPNGVGKELCVYYDKVGAESKCKYHPYAKKFCINPRLNTCFSIFASDAIINKIRKELIEEDIKATEEGDVCTKTGYPRRDRIVQYHKDVYARNGIPPACFPSWWPIESDGN